MTIIIDTNHDVTAKLPALKAAGVTTIGRYLNRRFPSEEKVIKPAEARAIAAAGLRLFLIYEYDGKPIGPAVGQADGEWALAYAKTIGAPLDGSAFIAYTVDYDASVGDMAGTESAFTEFGKAIAPAFQVAGYASGAVCSDLSAKKLIAFRWLTCSTGFRGTQAALAAKAYEMRQGLPQTLCGLDVDPNVLRDGVAPIGFIPFTPAIIPPAAPVVAQAPADGWLARFKKSIGIG